MTTSKNAPYKLAQRKAENSCKGTYIVKTGMGNRASKRRHFALLRRKTTSLV